MSNFKLDDFEMEKWYGIYTNDAGHILGLLKGKQNIETAKENADFLIMCAPHVDNFIYIKVNDIVNYYCLETLDSITEAEVFNPELEKYSINQGNTMTEILNKLIENWDEYDKEEKEFLGEEIVSALTTHNVVDLITSIVDYKKDCDDERQKYLRILKKHVAVKRKYNEFKDLFSDGFGLE